MDTDRTAQVAKLFDAVAPTYDQVGVDFFGPIAERLVGLVAPLPGERAIDIGCGRGAVTLPLAAAVGTTGDVRAYDIAPAMVEQARGLTRDLPQVSVEVMNAAEPSLPAASADLVTASCVLFFLPDPATSLRRWVELLVAGGRIGLTTFGPQDDTWRTVDALFDPYLPSQMLDARTSGTRGPFSSDASFDELVLGSGAATVETVTEPATLSFADVESWRRWTMSVGQRMMWGFVPEDDKPRLVERAAELLEAARGQDGMITVRQDVRYTVGRTAA